MFDLSAEFNKFYNNHVVLSLSEQNKLNEKAKLNIKRLNEGLEDYNIEHNTHFKVKGTYIQGSVAMSTVIQNDNKDYDIDIAIIFDKEDLGEMGPQATRNMVKNALEVKMKQFNAAPEVKTSCIRVSYEEGYHIDYAVYRRYYDYYLEDWIYEHAGSEWNKRGVNDLAEWFKNRNDESYNKLRKIVRLSKMFCKSRSHWGNMPSGLLQTILCDEVLASRYMRTDELFYYTMKNIISRLEITKEVNAPVDNGRKLTTRKIDIEKMRIWKNRLSSKIEDLDILFQEDCSKSDALQAWYGFFNHDFWEEESNKQQYSIKDTNVRKFNDNEEFIDDFYKYNLKYHCKLSGVIKGDGFRETSIRNFLSLHKYLPHNLQIICEMVESDCPKPYEIKWKVKNVGPEAERRNMVRGNIIGGGRKIVEHSTFYGNHYIECYIIKDNYCVAKQRINVPIGRR